MLAFPEPDPQDPFIRFRILQGTGRIVSYEEYHSRKFYLKWTVVFIRSLRSPETGNIDKSEVFKLRSDLIEFIEEADGRAFSMGVDYRQIAFENKTTAILCKLAFG